MCPLSVSPKLFGKILRFYKIHWTLYKNIHKIFYFHLDSPISSKSPFVRVVRGYNYDLSKDDEEVNDIDKDVDRYLNTSKKINSESKGSKRSSCDYYNSDDFCKSDVEEERRTNFTEREKIVNNKTVSYVLQVKMFHLCYGVSIFYSEWKVWKIKKRISS